MTSLSSAEVCANRWHILCMERKSMFKQSVSSEVRGNSGLETSRLEAELEADVVGVLEAELEAVRVVELVHLS